MVRVKIRDPKSGFRFNMPVPYHFCINIFVRKALIRFVLNHSEFKTEEAQKNAQRCVEAVDFEMLRLALHGLYSYRGMALVDIEAADGTIVKIQV